MQKLRCNGEAWGNRCQWARTIAVPVLKGSNRYTRMIAFVNDETNSNDVGWHVWNKAYHSIFVSLLMVIYWTQLKQKIFKINNLMKVYEIEMLAFNYSLINPCWNLKWINSHIICWFISSLHLLTAMIIWMIWNKYCQQLCVRDLAKW